MKRTIEIEATLQDCVNVAIEETAELLQEWLPDGYEGDVLEINDHGNATLWRYDGDDDPEAIDKMV